MLIRAYSWPAHLLWRFRCGYRAEVAATTVWACASERERLLRQRFGPAPGPSPPSPRRPFRPPAKLLRVGIAILLIVGCATCFLVLTPHDHAAPGCWWWTARTIGEVLPGQHGCLRGYLGPGGGLAEGTSSADFSLPLAYADPDQPARRGPCPFRLKDAVVVRYHAVFDDGRTIVVVDDCR